MTKEEKIVLFRTLYEMDKKNDAWLDGLPKSIASAFFDNEYSESLACQNALLRKAAFGKDTESIEWFLYEWKLGSEVRFNGVSKKIYSIDDYIEWIVEHEGFGED